MVCEIPPLAAPVLCPGGAKIKPPFEMGVITLILSYYCEFITEKSEKCVMIMINKEDEQKGGV